jgi:ubiquinone/menaquinone biosynthesis C-methylase UbiE
MSYETSKCYEKRINLGHFNKYLCGKGIDIGAGRDCLVVQDGTVINWDLKDGNGAQLKTIEENSLDFVYSSHLMEHIKDLNIAIKNYKRVLKENGIFYFVVPDFKLYEKNNWPSNYNKSHKHSFSIDIKREETHRENHWNIKENLEPLLNKFNFKVLECYLEDDNYNYNLDKIIDQTKEKENMVLAQICIIAKKEKI